MNDVESCSLSSATRVFPEHRSAETGEENATRECGSGTSIIDDHRPGFTDDPGIRFQELLAMTGPLQSQAQYADTAGSLSSKAEQGSQGGPTPRRSKIT